MYFVLQYTISDGYTYSSEITRVFDVPSEEHLLNTVLEAYKVSIETNSPYVLISGHEYERTGDFCNLLNPEEFMDHLTPADKWLKNNAESL